VQDELSAMRILLELLGFLLRLLQTGFGRGFLFFSSHLISPQTVWIVVHVHRPSVWRTSGARGSMAGSFSFAPLGWPFLIRLTHGLRRGLHSFAATRLGTSSQVYFSGDIEL